jgi:hypothetical protein
MDIISALKATTEKIRDWVDDKKVDKDGNKKLTDENYTSLEKTRVKNMVTGLGIVDGKLYLKNDNGIIESSATTLPSGGGSGGGTSASITLINKLDSNELTVALGGSANLVFEYSSSETGDTTPATAYVYIGDTLKKTYTVYPGENTLDIGEILIEGINSIKLTVSDIYSNQKSLAFSANVITLKITSTFDDSQIYDGDVTIRYHPYGAISKDVHLSIDKSDSIISTTSVTGVQQTHIISGDDLPHGAHDVEMYLSATIDDVTITSNKLQFCIVAEDSGVTTPIISSVCNTSEVTQGEQVQINYVCYDPVSTTTEVKLTVYQNGEIYSQTSRIVDATKQLWSVRDMPIGLVVLEIAYGTIIRTHTINVLENNINISIKEDDLEFQLYTEGKSNEDSDRAVWENNGVSTTFEYVNYESTGWVETETGTALRLFGKAKAKILAKPFSEDARQYGKTLELDFAIKNINNRTATPIRCMYSGIGFEVGADTATINSEQTSVSCNYTDEERIKISFVIEPKNEGRLLSVYLNGILSGVKQYPENDNFQQSEAQYIEIGSPYCAIDLYSIRSYNTCLSSREILNNYIASIVDISEKLSVYEDNDIYDIYGNLSFEEVKERMPVVLFTGASKPSFKGDKKTVTVDFTHNEKSILNYTDTAKIDIQGTSSQFLPKKNYKFKTNNYHMIDTDQIETNVICIKADFAECTSCRNTGGAKYVHTLYGDAKVPAQIDNEKVRTTIYGYPVAVFWRSDSNATPEFMYKGNYNYDKSSSEAFGFTSDYPDIFSIEFCNNTSDACRFHGEIPESWGDDFEYRHPDGYENIEDSGFKEMHSWVVSTYQEAATNIELEENYTGVDGTVYTKDTKEYRLAKFKKEFEDHFNMEFALIYYILSYVGLYIDSRCKNLFLTTFDRQHFYCYWYDLDTSWAINNEGLLSLSPYLTDTDLVDGTYVFNGQDSTLWTNFMMAFPDEITEKYKQLRSDGLISYDSLIENFIEEQCNKYSACMYNEDSEAKYISLLREENDAAYLYQVRGSGEPHFRYFVKERLAFCDSRWNCGDYPSDFVSLRIYTPLEYSDVEPNANITITPYTDGYFGVKYKANGTLIQQRAYENTPILFEAPNERFDDTETAVYGASRISSFGDLSPLYCGTIDLSAASNLVEIIVGAGGNYVNNNLKSFAVGANNLLKKVDIRNCPSLTDALDLSLCPSIEEIYAQGSSITAVKLPKSGFVRQLHLPASLTNLTITNQKYIEEFSLEGYNNLTTLHVEDVANVPVEDIMLNASQLNRIRLTDVSWEAESEEALEATIEKFENAIGMDANENNIGKPAVVAGRVKIDSISDELYNRCYESFPNLIIDDGSGTPYIINFLDRNGNSLFVTRVSEGANVTDPIEAGLIERPADIVADDYTYEFAGWSSLPQNVTQHYKITPVYKIKYTINYYNGDERIYQYSVYQGDPAIDPVATGAISTPSKIGTSDISYKFSGWDNLPINVQSSISVYAQYDTYWAARFWNGNTLYLTEWVKEDESVETPNWYFDDYVDPTRVSTAQYDYHFSRWDGDFDTPMIAAREFYAVYTSTIRRYNVYFYNGDTLLQTKENIQYGSSTSYTGSTPVKTGVENPDEYVFKGWLPVPENITGETYCYALFKFTGYLFGKLGKTDGEDYGYGTIDNPNWNTINAYWVTIASDVTSYKNGSLSEDDFMAKYPIGGRMIIHVALSDGTVTADVEIIGYNHDDLADGSGKSPLTFFCVDLPQTLHRMNEESSNEGGYEASEMREFINGELLTALPEDLKTIIKPVYKISDGGSTNKTLITTTDSCWLASYDEVGLTSGSNNLPGQGEVYSAIFSSNKDTRKKYITDDTSAGGWWLRSSYYSTNSNSMFWRVTNSGGSYSDIAFNSFYVSFGFCI